MLHYLYPASKTAVKAVKQVSVCLTVRPPTCIESNILTPPTLCQINVQTCLHFVSLTEVINYSYVWKFLQTLQKKSRIFIKKKGFYFLLISNEICSEQINLKIYVQSQHFQSKKQSKIILEPKFVLNRKNHFRSKISETIFQHDF